MNTVEKSENKKLKKKLNANKKKEKLLINGEKLESNLSSELKEKLTIQSELESHQNGNLHSESTELSEINKTSKKIHKNNKIKSNIQENDTNFQNSKENSKRDDATATKIFNGSQENEHMVSLKNNSFSNSKKKLDKKKVNDLDIVAVDSKNEICMESNLPKSNLSVVNSNNKNSQSTDVMNEEVKKHYSSYFELKKSQANEINNSGLSESSSVNLHKTESNGCVPIEEKSSKQSDVIEKFSKNCSLTSNCSLDENDDNDQEGAVGGITLTATNNGIADLPKQISSKNTNAQSNEIDPSNIVIEYKEYESELQMQDIMRLIQAELSEPYSIYTYRYFIYNWPKLCFLAAHNNEYVGAIVCKLDMHMNAVKRGYIAMLAVKKEYRKLKIGTNLVQKAIEAMLADDADEVVLETEMKNVPALRLYENLGFVRDKRLFRYYLNGVDALRLKLWFR